jgi:hypothetical protein
MKPLNILFITLIVFVIASCNKESSTTQTDVMNQMLTNKTWFLDYTIEEGLTSTTPVTLKNYVGQSTYFITYLKDGSVKDSDGLIGNYTVEIINKQSQIHIQLKSANGNPMEVIYDIISIGDSKMVISKQISIGKPTKFFFTTK